MLQPTTTQRHHRVTIHREFWLQRLHSHRRDGEFQIENRLVPDGPRKTREKQIPTETIQTIGGIPAGIQDHRRQLPKNGNKRTGTEKTGDSMLTTNPERTLGRDTPEGDTKPGSDPGALAPEANEVLTTMAQTIKAPTDVATVRTRTTTGENHLTEAIRIQGHSAEAEAEDHQDEVRQAEARQEGAHQVEAHQAEGQGDHQTPMETTFILHVGETHNLGLGLLLQPRRVAFSAHIHSGLMTITTSASVGAGTPLCFDHDKRNCLVHPHRSSTEGVPRSRASSMRSIRTWATKRRPRRTSSNTC